MKKLIIILLIAIAVLPACTKYKDGPKISLLSKKARIAGNWSIETVTVNGVDYTSQYNQLFSPSEKWTILKSGNYGYAGDYGTWLFGEDKDDATFTSALPGVEPKAYHILRLENKSLWMQYTAPNGSVTETHWKQ
jgi:hypothetical protein